MTPRSLTPKAEVTPPGGNDSRTTVPNVDDAAATKQTGSDEVSVSTARKDNTASANSVSEA